MAIYVPIIMYGLRLFIVVLQELHCLANFYSVFTEKYVFFLIGCCVSELHGHLCPYRNVWPEAVYSCFTRTTLFTKLFTCLYNQS